MADTGNIYTQNPSFSEAIRVFPIPADQDAVAHWSPLIQSVLLRAYSRDFEQPNGPLEPGAVRRYLFDPDNPEFVKRQTSRMHHYMARFRSTYYAAHILADAGEGDVGTILGVGKSSPSDSNVRRLLRREPNCFVNDIAAARPGVGIGVMLMDAMISPYSEERRILLDTFSCSKKANHWYARLGFAVDASVRIEPLEVGEQTFPQHRMVHPFLGEVRARLWGHYRWLYKGAARGLDRAEG